MRVYDCVGLVKGYLWSQTPTSAPKYNASQDKDVNGVKASCSNVSDIRSIPEIPGILVFMKGHAGIYIGNGKVIEARGHAYGVVQTDLNKRGWKEWGKLDWLEYEEEKTMSKEEQIKLIQEKAGLDDNTMQYLQFYRYGDDLIEKLANAMK